MDELLSMKHLWKCALTIAKKKRRRRDEKEEDEEEQGNIDERVP